MKKIIQSFVADVNGDGVLDFVVVDSDHRWTALNGATGLTDDIPAFPPNHQIPGWPCWGRYFFSDFTGNGIADRAYLNSDGNWFVVDGSSGGPGVPGIPWGSQIPGWPGDGRISVADFNGDGKAERCYLNSEGQWFVVDSDGSPGIHGIPWGSSIPGWPADGHYFISDFTGDGAADRLYLHPDGGWYLVNSKTGASGTSAFPWGKKIPGWPGGGRYVILDFNDDGIADRCYVHPKGRCYVVNSASGAPMDNISQLGDWGAELRDTGKILMDVIMFQASSVMCAYTLGANWLACLGAVNAAYRTYADLSEIVERNRKREHDAIKKQDRDYRPDHEPYLRAYPPKSDGSSGENADFHIHMSITVHVESNCKENNVEDCPSGPEERERPDTYNRPERLRDDDGDSLNRDFVEDKRSTGHENLFGPFLTMVSPKATEKFAKVDEKMKNQGCTPGIDVEASTDSENDK